MSLSSKLVKEPKSKFHTHQLSIVVLAMVLVLKRVSSERLAHLVEVLVPGHLLWRMGSKWRAPAIVAKEQDQLFPAAANAGLVEEWESYDRSRRQQSRFPSVRIIYLCNIYPLTFAKQVLRRV